MKTINVRSGDNLQGAINQAAPGDTVELEAGATWEGTYVIPQNCPPDNPLTLRSSRHAELPPGRVGPNIQADSIAEAGKMARILALGGDVGYGAALSFGPNAGGVLLDGLELSDSPDTPRGRIVHALIDAGNSNPGVHDLTVRRCYLHQKEKGSNYNRSVMRGVWFEGRNFIMEKSYVFLIGYYYPEASGTEFYQMDTAAMICVGQGRNVGLKNNFLDTWWNIWFLGGADTGPSHTATLTNATMDSARFSNAELLTKDVVLRLSVKGRGIWNATTRMLEVTSGTIDAGDGGRALVGNHDGGSSIVLTQRSPGAIPSVNCRVGFPIKGSIVPVEGNVNGDGGEYDWELYQSVIVTSVEGDVVHYRPFGVDRLRHAGAAKAAWCVGDEGLITDAFFLNNTVYLDPVFAEHVRAKKGYCNKGIWETKNVNRELIEGNIFLGMPSGITWTASNQSGSAPWIKCDNVKIRNNWFEPDPDHTACCGPAIMYTDNGYGNTVAQTDGSIILPNSVEITNNLILNHRSFLDSKFGKDWLIAHNTVINNLPTEKSFNALMSNQDGPLPNLEFRDNIAGIVCYGFNGYPSAYPNARIKNNVLVDADRGCSGGINENTYGPGSGLTPIPTRFADVGFIDMVNRNFKLAQTSPYKGKGTDGRDPGVDMDQLLAAIGGDIPVPPPPPNPADPPPPPPPPPGPVDPPPPPPPPPPDPVTPPPSADGTKAITITDGTGGVWTIGPQHELLRNGAHISFGYGTMYKWYQGKVYVLGTDKIWYRFVPVAGPVVGLWETYGPTEPGFIPPPPPPPIPPKPDVRTVAWPATEAAQDKVLAQQWKERYRMKRNLKGDKAEFEKVD